MAITSILRNFNGTPSIVFIQSTDVFSEITARNYITIEQPNIDLVNNGTFTFESDDYCLINYADGEGFFKVDLEDQTFVATASDDEIVTHKVTILPPTPDSGKFEIESSDNTNEAVVKFKVDSFQTDTTYHLAPSTLTPDMYFVTSVTQPDAYTETLSFSITATALELQTSKTLISGGGLRQFVILSLNISSSGTDFSGGGGDRGAKVTDLTNTFTTISSAIMQSHVNASWGSTDLPFPVSVGISQPTQPGAALVLLYDGGTTDYTTGDITITGTVLRVA